MNRLDCKDASERSACDDSQNERSEGFFEVLNSKGMHARPCAALVKCASNYPCDVFLIYDGIRVNAKSLLGLMALAVSCGTQVKIEAEGPSASLAVRAIIDLAARGFGSSF